MIDSPSHHLELDDTRSSKVSVLVARQAVEKEAAGVTPDGPCLHQLPFTDTYRTLCEAPTAELRRVFEQGRELTAAA